MSNKLPWALLSACRIAAEFDCINQEIAKEAFIPVIMLAKILKGGNRLVAIGLFLMRKVNTGCFQAAGTMGALDLGGASTQITFVSGQSVESPDNSMDFRLYGNDYQLYTHSFLCYGKDQVLKLALEKRLMVRQHSTEEERLDLKEIH